MNLHDKLISKETPLITVRAAHENDFSEVIHALEELGYPSMEPSLQNHVFSEILKSNHSGILVGEVETQFAGFLTFSQRQVLRYSSWVIEIDELHVLSRFRGAGLGALMIQEMKRIANERNINRIVVSTNRSRESYRRGFYVKNGFTESSSAIFGMDL